MHNNSKIYQAKYWFLSFASAVIFISFEIYAQMPQPPAPVEEEIAASPDNTWQYIVLFILVLGLIGSLYWVYASRKAKTEAADGKNKLSSKEDTAVDADEEMEWLRRNKKLMKSNSRNVGAMNKNTGNLPQNIDYSRKAADSAAALEKAEAVMPIFSFEKSEHSRPFDKLPISNDPALMSAVEQVQDEFEEDEMVRELAVKILKAFRNRNAVDALSQVALYDLSATLRSNAVTILSDFDHESVFEVVLLACADPTREVRAAAARALFRLSFDRADAWTRIVETGEEGRMIQAARAAHEGGFVEQYIERLIHPDQKTAYEAFTLIALVVKSGETKMVFEALKNHKKESVRQAILHVIKITKDTKALGELYSMLESKNLNPEMQEMIDQTIEEIGFVTA